MRQFLHQLLRQNRGFIALLLLIGVFRSAVADWNPIPSGSMRPNLQEGDVVLVNRLAYQLKVPLTDHVIHRLGDPARGDVATFSSPVDGRRLIKRIVAVPGDVVEMRDKMLFINGSVAEYAPLGIVNERIDDRHTLEALRLRESSAPSSRTIQWLAGVAGRDSFGPVAVPPDHYLMLGDNRDNSADSRYFGLVPRDRLIGRADRILVSLDITDRWQPRLDRFGQRLE